MPKRKIKTEKCLNCGYHFESQTFDYCPLCGQENDTRLKSLSNFLVEFLEDLFSVDTRLFRSIPIFLFRPGKLTKEYIAGKRKKYITPIRLYLTLSFVYFLIFSYYLTNSSYNEYADFGNKPVIEIGNNTKKTDSRSQNRTPKPEQKNIEKTSNQSDKLMIWGIDVEAIQLLSKQKGMNEKKALDSLKVKHTFWRLLLVKQFIRLNNATSREILNNFLNKIPLMMFVLLPIFALLLKILYIRRKKYFIEHLIFILHLHSFFFLIFSIWLFSEDLLERYAENIGLGVGIILILYTFQSFRNVYQQNWFKTLFKLFFILMGYVIILALGLLGALLVSLIFF